MTEDIHEKQTEGQSEERPENRFDRIAARISVVYLLLMLFFFFWQLFDIWVRQFTLARWLGYPSLTRLDTTTFRIFAYTFIGGGLGGIINGIRSFNLWHSEKGVFGQRYVWKYVTYPWLGATLALIVYTLMRSGMAVLGGEISPDTNATMQVLSVFALGAIAGYGSRDVFIWLDEQVSRIFKVEKPDNSVDEPPIDEPPVDDMDNPIDDIEST